MYIHGLLADQNGNVQFPLVAAGTTDFVTSAPTFAAGDVQVRHHGDTQFNNVTNLPVYWGNGVFNLSLTSVEMPGERTSADLMTAPVIVTLIDSPAKVWEDTMLVISTVGAINRSEQLGTIIAKVAASPAPTVNAFAITGTSLIPTGDDRLNERLFTLTNGEQRYIEDFTGATGLITVESGKPLTEIPQVDSKVIIS